MCILGAVLVSFMVRRAIKKAEEAGVGGGNGTGGGGSRNNLAGMVALPVHDGEVHLAAEDGEGGGEEREGLLASTSPRTLEREGYIRNIPGLSRLAEASNAIFNLQPAAFLSSSASSSAVTAIGGVGSVGGAVAATPEKSLKSLLAHPGTLTKHLRSGSKAKMSPRAEREESKNTFFSTPFKNQDQNNNSTRDVELGGTSSLTLSANRRPSRRTSSRIDYNSDDNE